MSDRGEHYIPFADNQNTLTSLAAEIDNKSLGLEIIFEQRERFTNSPRLRRGTHDGIVRRTSNESEVPLLIDAMNEAADYFRSKGFAAKIEQSNDGFERVSPMTWYFALEISWESNQIDF